MYGCFYFFPFLGKEKIRHRHCYHGKLVFLFFPTQSVGESRLVILVHSPSFTTGSAGLTRQGIMDASLIPWMIFLSAGQKVAKTPLRVA
jgi:hypothetical protein